MYLRIRDALEREPGVGSEARESSATTKER